MDIVSNVVDSVIENKTITWENGIYCKYSMEGDNLFDVNFFNRDGNRLTLYIKDHSILDDSKKDYNSTAYNISAVCNNFESIKCITDFVDFDSLYYFNKNSTILDHENNYVMSRCLYGILFLEHKLSYKDALDKIEKIKNIDGIETISYKIRHYMEIYEPIYSNDAYVIELTIKFMSQELANLFLKFKEDNSSNEERLEMFIESMI